MNKKVYVRPDAMLVDFSLSSSIAAACKFTATSTDPNTCDEYKIDGGWIVMANTNALCDFAPDSPDLCYHVPTADTSVFSS